MKIIEAKSEHFPIIQQIAQTTWYPTFGDILSKEQIAYMLEMMYSLPALEKQVNEQKHIFLIAEEEGEFLGYISYEIDYKGKELTKIHKIYILPNTQGKGVGQQLMNEVQQRALANKNPILALNVNRYNKALKFYEKYGFKVVGQENIDIGNGYLMEDLILEKEL